MFYTSNILPKMCNLLFYFLQVLLNGLNFKFIESWKLKFTKLDES